MATAIPTNSTPKGHLSSDFSQMKQTEGEMKEEGKNKLRSASTLGDAIGQLKRKKFSERERERKRNRRFKADERVVALIIVMQ